MLTILHCRHCKSETIQPGIASCHLDLTLYEHCSSCHHTHDRHYKLYFCSSPCLLKYLSEKKEEFIGNVKGFETIPNWPCGFTTDTNGVRHCVDLELR